MDHLCGKNRINPLWPPCALHSRSQLFKIKSKHGFADYGYLVAYLKIHLKHFHMSLRKVMAPYKNKAPHSQLHCYLIRGLTTHCSQLISICNFPKSLNILGTQRGMSKLQEIGLAPLRRQRWLQSRAAQDASLTAPPALGTVAAIAWGRACKTVQEWIP
jgi:hypothetical protein